MGTGEPHPTGMIAPGEISTHEENTASAAIVEQEEDSDEAFSSDGEGEQ